MQQATRRRGATDRLEEAWRACIRLGDALPPLEQLWQPKLGQEVELAALDELERIGSHLRGGGRLGHHHDEPISCKGDAGCFPRAHLDLVVSLLLAGLGRLRHLDRPEGRGARRVERGEIAEEELVLLSELLHLRRHKGLGARGGGGGASLDALEHVDLVAVNTECCATILHAVQGERERPRQLCERLVRGASQRPEP